MTRNWSMSRPIWRKNGSKGSTGHRSASGSTRSRGRSTGGYRDRLGDGANFASVPWDVSSAEFTKATQRCRSGSPSHATGADGIWEPGCQRPSPSATGRATRNGPREGGTTAAPGTGVSRLEAGPREVSPDGTRCRTAATARDTPRSRPPHLARGPAPRPGHRRGDPGLLLTGMTHVDRPGRPFVVTELASDRYRYPWVTGATLLGGGGRHVPDRLDVGPFRPQRAGSRDS